MGANGNGDIDLMPGYRGIATKLHDGRAGLRLICEECEDDDPTCEGCYQLALEGFGETPEEVQDALLDQLGVDGYPEFSVEVRSLDPADFTVTATYS